MGKFGKYLAWTVASLAALLLTLMLVIGGVGFWAYKNPLEAFHAVEKYFLPADLKITWDKLDFEGEHLGGLNFLIDIAFEGLHVQKGSTIDLPLDHARLRSSVFPMARNAQIHRAELIAEKPIIYHAGPDKTPSAPKNPFQRIQDFIHLLKFIEKRAPIEIFEAKARTIVFKPYEGNEISIRASIQKVPEQPLQFAAAMSLPGATNVDIDAHGDIRFDKIGTADDFLTTAIQFKGYGVDTKLEASLNDADASTRLRVKGPVNYRKDKLNLSFAPQLDAHFTEKEAKLDLVTDIRGIPGPIVHIEKISLKMTTPLESGKSWSEKPSNFSLAVPVQLYFVPKNRLAAMEKACDCDLPEIVMARANGKVWLTTLLTDSPKNRTAIETKLDVESVKNKTFTIDLAADLKVDREGKTFKYFPHLDCAATVHSFKRLKPLLDVNGVLIPAPFDILDGTLIFKAQGPIATTEQGSQFPLALAVDLASPTQKVKVDTNAAVLLNPKFTEAHLDVSAKIAALNLDLPPLDPLGGLPRVARDTRFIKTPPDAKPKPSKFKLSFNFAVETTPEGVIHLRSKYFTPNLPLRLKVQSTGGTENTGFIASEPFDVTYLRRTVRVENLRIDLDGSDKGVFPLRGRMSVQQTQYTVFIDVVGTTKSPTVTLSSEPYLPKNEIVSVLLYDRTSDQLVSGDAETAGGVQAALADRAIGLFGLWAFATTPIKSFTYNPVTKVYSATVAVSDDLTAGVGTNWEASARLELRKRISRRWSLTAAWTPATQEESATSKLVLQWEKRF